MRSGKNIGQGRESGGSERILKRVLAVEAPFHEPKFDLAGLRQQGILLYRTLSLAHACTIWGFGSYDLVVVDENLGEDPVIEFCRELKERCPQQRIALITENTSEQNDIPYVDATIHRHKGTMLKRASTLLRAAWF